MSYIENLTGSVVNASVQESLALGAGNFKIKGFDLTTSGNYKVLSSGLAIIDGLRIVSTGNLQILGSSALNKYVFLRINTYTQVENGITVRKADLSLIAQTSNTPVNNTDLYTNITGTKDVLLDFVDSSGVVNGALVYSLMEYDSTWKPITLSATYTGSISYRLWNKVLYFRGIATRTSGNVTHGDIMGNLQRTFSGSQEKSAIARGSGSTPINVTLKTNGELYLAINAGTTSTFVCLDGISFMY